MAGGRARYIVGGYSFGERVGSFAIKEFGYGDL